MPYPGFCMPNGACIIIIVSQTIQSVFESLVRWYLSLAGNVEFIGVAAGISVLLYVELEIRSLDTKIVGNMRKGLHQVSDFFLFSVGTFLVSAILDWINSQQFPVLSNNFVVSLVEAGLFAAGLFSLALGAGSLREIGRTGKTRIALPRFATLIIATVWITLNAGALVGSLSIWNQMQTVGQIFLVLDGLTILPAIFLTITAYGKKFKIKAHGRNWERLTIALILLTLPWLIVIIASFVPWVPKPILI